MVENINKVSERNTLGALGEFNDFTKVCAGSREAIRDGADPRASTTSWTEGNGCWELDEAEGSCHCRGW